MDITLTSTKDSIPLGDAMEQEIKSASAAIASLAEAAFAKAVVVCDVLVVNATHNYVGTTNGVREFRQKYHPQKTRRLQKEVAAEYKRMARSLDFSVPSFEINYDDLPDDFWTEGVGALPFHDFICAINVEERWQVYYFKGHEAGTTKVHAFRHCDGLWGMIDVELTIAPDGSCTMPSALYDDKGSYNCNWIAVEMLALINLPKYLTIETAVDERTIATNRIRKLSGRKEIPPTRKIVIHKNIAPPDRRVFSETPIRAPKAPHDRRGHMRWLKKTQRWIRVKHTRIHGGSSEAAKYSVRIEPPPSTHSDTADQG